MRTSVLGVQEAIFEVLKNNEQLIQLMQHTDGYARVFDEEGIVPEPIAFPYIAIGGRTSVPFNTFGKLGQDVTLMIHGWSQKSSKYEIEIIHDLIFDALDDISLPMFGYRSIQCLLEFSQIMADNATNIKKWHLIDRYRIRTEEV